MEFCKKCGTLMVPQKKGSKTVLICRKCGTTKGGKIDSRMFKIKTKRKNEKKEVVVVDKKSKLDVLPKTRACCPKCSHNEAFWWMQQTRAADEAPTRFYKCVKCSHTWREYE